MLSMLSMLPKHLFWRLLPSYFVITVVAIIATSLYGLDVQRRFYLDQTASDLAVRTTLLLPKARAGLRADKPAPHTCAALGVETHTRITLIRPDGRVLCDSHADPARMDNHGTRPEVLGARAMGLDHSVRTSATLHLAMMYVARAVRGPDAELQGYVRVAVPVTALDGVLRVEQQRFLLAALAILLAAAALSWLVSRRLIRPLEAMRVRADAIAQGESRQPLPVPETEELAALSRALNRMLAELDNQILTVSHQHNELKTILDSMAEGVLVVDTGGCIFKMNAAAGRLLGVCPEAAVGHRLSDALNNVALSQFVSRALESDFGSKETELVVNGEAERVVRVLATLVEAGPTAEGPMPFAAVLVLNDITAPRRLDTIRRDFVANVSQELRGPVETIRGFVDVLGRGGLDDPEQIRHLLARIGGDADRMSAIIEDLLTLARVERLQDMQWTSIEQVPLRPVLNSALVGLRDTIRQHEVNVRVDCPEGLQAWVSPALLQQALANLVDNATKYGGDGGEVRISVERHAGDVRIRVSDRGAGIAEQHLPRLFERFYRADVPESRQKRGTGLGLAIVKHIAQEHGGRVEVRSRLGLGSEFTLHLPQPQDPAVPGRGTAPLA